MVPNLFVVLLALFLLRCEKAVVAVELVTTTALPPPDNNYFANGTILQCTFDVDMCDFYNDVQADLQWVRWTKQSPGQYTGPDFDHTSGNGYYMMLPANRFYQRKGWVARLHSPEITAIYSSCVNITFWYFAYGFHLGKLTVAMKKTPYLAKNWTTLFEIRGADQTQSWRFFQSMQQDITSFRFYFEGSIGEGPQGNYAIDDVQVNAVPCPTTTPGPTVTGIMGQLFYATTTQQPPENLQVWMIALIVVLCVAAIGTAVIAFFVYYRQRRLRILKERQEAEKAERQRQEIERYGMILRTMPNRPASAVPLPLERSNTTVVFDRPLIGRANLASANIHRPKTAAAGSGGHNSTGEREEDTSYVHEDNNNADPANKVYVIQDKEPDLSYAQMSPAPPPRTRSAVARGVHNVDLTPAFENPHPHKLPPMISTISGGGSIGSSRSPTSPGRQVRFSGKDEKMTWFEEDSNSQHD